MAKQLNPTRGCTVKGELAVDMKDPGGLLFSAQKEEATASRMMRMVAAIARELKDGANLVGCMSYGQAEILDHRINHIASQAATAGEVFNPSISAEVMALMTWVNSCSLSCADCTNDECASRDPLIPVSQVMARAKKTGVDEG